MQTYKEESIPWATLRTALENAGRPPQSFTGSFRSKEVSGPDLWPTHSRLAILVGGAVCSWALTLTALS